MYELKIYRGVELCVMTMKNDAKTEEGLTRQVFTRALKNHKNLHFNTLLLIKVNNVWAKKSIVGLFLMELNIDAKFEEKMNCAFKNA